MSARTVLTAALTARLRAAAGLAGVGVLDQPSARALPPYAVVEEVMLLDRGAVGLSGREGRVTVSLADSGDTPARLRGWTEAAEVAVLGLGGELGEGWRVTTVVLARSRIVRAKGERWLGASDFVLRMYRADS